MILLLPCCIFWCIVLHSVAPYCIVLHCVAWCYIVLHGSTFVLHRATSCCIVLHHATSCFVVSISCYIVFHRVASSYVVLYWACKCITAKRPAHRLCLLLSLIVREIIQRVLNKRLNFNTWMFSFLVPAANIGNFTKLKIHQQLWIAIPKQTLLPDRTNPFSKISLPCYHKLIFLVADALIW